MNGLVAVNEIFMDEIKLRSNIIRFWGNYLQVVPSIILSNFILPEVTSTFLTTIGIPFQVYMYKGILPMDFLDTVNAIETFSFKNTSYILIATDNNDLGVKIGIEDKSGEVFDVASFLEEPVAFVNSNVLLFLEFVKIFIENINTQDNSDISLSKAIGSIKFRFDELDPRALEKGAYWSEFLEGVM